MAIRIDTTFDMDDPPGRARASLTEHRTENEDGKEEAE